MTNPQLRKRSKNKVGHDQSDKNWKLQVLNLVIFKWADSFKETNTSV